MLALALVVSTLALPASSASPCTHAQLRLHVGPADGAAGTIFYPLTFTNVSARACTLRGYPGVSSVRGSQGVQVGDPARRERFPVHRVRLRARGGKATAVYGQVDVGVFSRSLCRPVRTRGLRVYAPNQTRAFFAPLRHRACSAHGAGDSHVRPVVAGATGL
jgi:Protein of unknown function (DUF4232)